MAKKGRRSTSSKRLAKKTQKMMKSSCMYGGDFAPYSGSGSGATGYGEAIYGPANAQTNNGFGSNNIKMADPAVVWKGGQRGGENVTSGTITFSADTPVPNSNPTVNIPSGTSFQIGPTVMVDAPAPATAIPTTSTGGSRGGSMLGAAIVPAALLAANQLYKPSRALKNLNYSRKNGFRKTMKKFRKGRR
jgi:hypothetical protein